MRVHTRQMSAVVPHTNTVGIEQDAVATHAAMERAPWALIHEGDFFTWAAATHERFNAVGGNPPFIRYQTFAGDLCARALALCQRLGADFTGLTSSWAPFVVASGLQDNFTTISTVSCRRSGDAVCLGITANATAEPAGQPHKVGVLERLVRSGQRPPPHPEPARTMAHAEVRV